MNPDPAKPALPDVVEAALALEQVALVARGIHSPQRSGTPWRGRFVLPVPAETAPKFIISISVSSLLHLKNYRFELPLIQPFVGAIPSKRSMNGDPVLCNECLSLQISRPDGHQIMLVSVIDH